VGGRSAAGLATVRHRGAAVAARRTREETSAVMRRVRSGGTGPEVELRRRLWRGGARYRLGARDLPGRPDLVFRTRKLAVFVDGDYWHGGQWYRRGHTSLEEQLAGVRNPGYWLGKIRRNVERDLHSTEELLRGGWKVLRFWESGVRRDPEGCVELTVSALTSPSWEAWAAQLPSRTFVEFFAGIGLVRLALTRRGWTGVFADDIDPQKREMYARNFPHDRPGHLSAQDVHDLSGKEVPAATMVTASFPCNDLSVAGARHGLVGRQSSAFWGLIRVLRAMGERRPGIVLLENVVGFLTSHGGADLRSALVALNELGYTCDAFVLDAASFVPQSRQRLFVVGLADRPAPIPASGVPRIYDSAVRPRALCDFIDAHPEVDWYLRALPQPPTRETRLSGVLEDLADDDPMWWSRERCGYLLGQMSARHGERAREMIEGDDVTHGTVFRRVRGGRSMAELRTDGVAGCLRTPRGGSGRQILFEAGRGRYRCRLLSPRECARLQGAPESFRVDFPLNQALFGLGDAVCVPVIEWIAEHYLNPVVTELLRGRLLYPGPSVVAPASGEPGDTRCGR